MRDRLPIHIENLELPDRDDSQESNKNNSYGYVSFMYLVSLIITIGSVLVIIFCGK